MASRIVRLVKEALKEQPRGFTQPARDVLSVARMSEDRMPLWYAGNDWKWATSPADADVIPVRPLSPELKKEAAPLWVWWRDWVSPVLEAVAADPAATGLVMEALPAPELFIPGKTKSDTWRSKFCSPPVDLWLLWLRWNDLTDLTALPPAPDYPNTPKSPHDAFLFLSFLWTGFYADLRCKPARIVNRTRDALRWLRHSSGQPGKATPPLTSDAAIAKTRSRSPGVGKERGLVFICYCHKDKKWLDEMRKMLAPVIWRNVLPVWHDRKVKPGDKWRREIAKALRKTKVGVLLVTKNFLASEFINEVELKYLLENAQTHHIKLLPVYVGHCMWEKSPLGELQFANDTAKPLAQYRGANRDRLLKEVCENIQAAYNEHSRPQRENGL